MTEVCKELGYGHRRGNSWASLRGERHVHVSCKLIQPIKDDQCLPGILQEVLEHCIRAVLWLKEHVKQKLLQGQFSFQQIQLPKLKQESEEKLR